MDKIEKERQKYNKIKNNKFISWWKKNDYKVYRIILFPLFPIWVTELLWEKYKDYKYKKLVFNEEKCKKYLDFVIPKMVVRYNDDHNEILISNADDMGGIEFSDFHSSWMHKKYRKQYLFFLKFYSEIADYILEKYQIEGYKKNIVDNWKEWNKAKEQFGWYDTPYYADSCKGVIFYKE